MKPGPWILTLDELAGIATAGGSVWDDADRRPVRAFRLLEMTLGQLVTNLRARRYRRALDREE